MIKLSIVISDSGREPHAVITEFVAAPDNVTAAEIVALNAHCKNGLQCHSASLQRVADDLLNELRSERGV